MQVVLTKQAPDSQRSHSALSKAALLLWNLQQQYSYYKVVVAISDWPSVVSSASSSTTHGAASSSSSLPSQGRPLDIPTPSPDAAAATLLPRSTPATHPLSLEGLKDVPFKFIIQIYANLFIDLCHNIEVMEFPMAWDNSLDRTRLDLGQRLRWAPEEAGEDAVRFINPRPMNMYLKALKQEEKNKKK